MPLFTKRYTSVDQIEMDAWKIARLTTSLLCQRQPIDWTTENIQRATAVAQLVLAQARVDALRLNRAAETR